MRRALTPVLLLFFVAACSGGGGDDAPGNNGVIDNNGGNNGDNNGANAGNNNGGNNNGANADNNGGNNNGGNNGCQPQSCDALGKNCGLVDDGCGSMQRCGSCGAPETCGGGGVDNVCGQAPCEPTSCAAQNAECGSIPDGCGGELSCGDCSDDQSCGGDAPNRCGDTPCEPATQCASVDAECGVVSDGCAGTLDCGGCGEDALCGEDNRCAEIICEATTCAAEGAECGSIPDGCGAQLECGRCGDDEICGGGGAPNVCGEAPCEPTTCAAQGRNCGEISDGCGIQLSCGSCEAPQSCGGGGAPGVCGCTPTSCQAAGRNCGSLDDGCGNLLSCGECQGSETCGGGGQSGVCGCVPTSCEDAGAECGEVANGCGGTLMCGGCEGHLSCGGGGLANLCGAECVPGCPVRYSCDTQGECTGGDHTRLDLDISAIEVAGRVTVNGAPYAPFDNCSNFFDDAGVLTVTNLDTGSTSVLDLPCRDNDFSFRLAPGSWQFRVAGAGSDLPRGGYTLPMTFDLDRDRTDLLLDVPAIDVSGRVTVNGEAYEPFGNCSNFFDDAGVLSFVNADDPESSTVMDLPCRDNDFSFRLAPGRWRAFVSGAGSNLPRGRYEVTPALDLTRSRSDIALDIPAVDLSGTVTVNGVPYEPFSNCSNFFDDAGVLTFTDINNPGSTSVQDLPCRSTDFAQRLYPGSWRVQISGAGSDLPRGTYTLPTLQVSGDRSDLVFDVPAIDLSGTVTVNGAPYEPFGNCSNFFDDAGVLTFSDADNPGSTSVQDLPCGSNEFSRRLYPGRWIVTLSGAGSNLPRGSYTLPAQQWNSSLSNLVFDVPAIEVTVTVLVNGAPYTPVSNCSNFFDDAGVLTFSDTQRPGSSSFGDLPCNSGDRLVFSLYPGEWSASVSGAGSDLPRPVYHFDGMSLNQSMELTLDVPAVTVTGSLSVSGSPYVPVSNCSNFFDDAGVLTLVNLGNGEGAALDLPCGSNDFSLRIYPGVWQVLVSGAGSNIPRASPIVVRRLQVP